MSGGAVVVFDGVSGSDDLCIFETCDGLDEVELHIVGQGCGDAVDVVFESMASFRLEEDLVAFFVCKLDDFVLDGRAIAGAWSFDFPCIHGGFIEVITDDVVGFWGGVSDVAGNLFHVEL